jgi:UDP-hydrolysing UDP-N-acetyl-D-glucosamine 2-epimerase
MGADGRMRRRVAVVTGIRSEYDILFSTLSAITQDPSLDLQLIVTGTHLANVYGRTVTEIESDGFDISERVESLLAADSVSGRAKSVGIQLTGLAQALSRLQPSIVVAPCDREESITAALAATYLNIPVAHLCGGDRTDSGIVDEQIRHATTKLAQLHLVMTEGHAERVRRLGEEPWRVRVVGHGGLDRLLSTPALSREELSSRVGLDLSRRPVGVVIQHAINNEIPLAAAHMRTTLEAVEALNLTAAIIFPNSDTGSQDIIRVIREFESRLPHCRVVANLPRLEFVNLLRHADVLIGNSSSGIIEAPSLGLPAINVGRRQVGREVADNVIFVHNDQDEIVQAVRRALADADFRERLARKRNPYGDGQTGPRIADILASVDLGPGLLNKTITY